MSLILIIVVQLLFTQNIYAQFCCIQDEQQQSGSYVQSTLSQWSNTGNNYSTASSLERIQNDASASNFIDNVKFGRWIMNSYFASFDGIFSLESTMTPIYPPSEFSFESAELKWDYITKLKVGTSATDYFIGGAIVTMGERGESSIKGISQWNINNDFNFFDTMYEDSSYCLWPGGACYKQIMQGSSTNQDGSYRLSYNVHHIPGFGIIDYAGGQASNFSCQNNEFSFIINSTIEKLGDPRELNQLILDFSAIGSLLDSSLWRLYTSFPVQVYSNNDYLRIRCGGDVYEYTRPIDDRYECSVPICIPKSEISMRKILEWTIKTKAPTIQAYSNLLWPSAFIPAGFSISHQSSRAVSQANDITLTADNFSVHKTRGHRALYPPVYYKEDKQTAIVDGWLCHVSTVKPLVSFTVDFHDYSMSAGTNELLQEFYKTTIDKTYSALKGRQVQNNIDWISFKDNPNAATGFYIAFQWDNGCVDFENNPIYPFAPQPFFTLLIEGTYLSQ